MSSIIKPITTLFMLISVDGKISTGATNIMDVDKDFPKIDGIKKGLHQYYDIEKTTDMYFMISGKVMAKECPNLDVNNKIDIPKKLPANCIIIDNIHLKKSGVKYLSKKFNSLTIITKNKNHPAKNILSDKLKMINYEKEIDFTNLFNKLKTEFHIDTLTIQSGGTLNSTLLRNNLIDKLSIVIAPALIGGKDTPTLIDGESLISEKELKLIKALKLTDVKKLKNSYIHIKYNVLNNT